MTSCQSVEGFSLLCFLLCTSVITVVTEMAKQKDKAENTQLVHYNHQFFDPFHKPSQQFNLAGKDWIITQDWDQLGVAGVIWKAAVTLSYYLVKNRSLLVGKHVIELGAGTGLVSMVAGSLGAADVIATDKRVDMIETNIHINQKSLVNVNVSIVQYEWGKPLPSSLTPPYDVILGADIIYIEDSFPDLIESMKILCDSNTLILLSAQERYDRVKRFKNSLKNCFKYTLVYSEDPVDIYQLTKINGSHCHNN